MFYFILVHTPVSGYVISSHGTRTENEKIQEVSPKGQLISVVASDGMGLVKKSSPLDSKQRQLQSQDKTSFLVHTPLGKDVLADSIENGGVSLSRQIPEGTVYDTNYTPDSTEKDEIYTFGAKNIKKIGRNAIKGLAGALGVEHLVDVNLPKTRCMQKIRVYLEQRITNRDVYVSDRMKKKLQADEQKLCELEDGKARCTYVKKGDYDGKCKDDWLDGPCVSPSNQKMTSGFQDLVQMKCATGLKIRSKSIEECLDSCYNKCSSAAKENIDTACELHKNEENESHSCRLHQKRVSPQPTFYDDKNSNSRCLLLGIPKNEEEILKKPCKYNWVGRSGLSCADYAEHKLCTKDRQMTKIFVPFFLQRTQEKGEPVVAEFSDDSIDDFDARHCIECGCQDTVKKVMNMHGHSDQCYFPFMSKGANGKLNENSDGKCSSDPTPAMLHKGRLVQGKKKY